MECASNLREKMWSEVIEISSKINFIYEKSFEKYIIKFNEVFNSL